MKRRSVQRVSLDSLVPPLWPRVLQISSRFRKQEKILDVIQRVMSLAEVDEYCSNKISFGRSIDRVQRFLAPQSRLLQAQNPNTPCLLAFDLLFRGNPQGGLSVALSNPPYGAPPAAKVRFASIRTPTPRTPQDTPWIHPQYWLTPRLSIETNNFRLCSSQFAI